MRELTREEWLRECEEKRNQAHDLIKGISKASFIRMKADGKYGEEYGFTFDEREMRAIEYLRSGEKDVYKNIMIAMDIEKVFVQYPDDEEVEEWNGQVEEEEIETVRLASFEELRELTGMSVKEFIEYIGVPLRTYQGWRAGERTCPEYTLKLVNEKVIRDFSK